MYSDDDENSDAHIHVECYMYSSFILSIIISYIESNAFYLYFYCHSRLAPNRVAPYGDGGLIEGMCGMPQPPPRRGPSI